MTALGTFFANLDKWDLYVAGIAILATWWVVKLKGKRCWNWDHFWQNLDKLILLFLFLVTILVVLHILHHGTVDNSMISWMENTSGQILSALLAVLGARALTRKTDGSASGTETARDVVIPTVVNSLTASGEDGQ